MTPATMGAPIVETELSMRDRTVDAARQMAHVSHEARLLKSLAADAVEDGVHAAKRAIKSGQRRVEELGDVKDEAASRVKRQPFTALAIAVGVGLVFGIGMAWIGSRLGKEQSICGGS